MDSLSPNMSLAHVKHVCVLQHLSLTGTVATRAMHREHLKEVVSMENMIYTKMTVKISDNNKCQFFYFADAIPIAIAV